MAFNELILGATIAMLATSFGAVLAIFLRKLYKNYTPALAFSGGVMAYTALEMFMQSHKMAGDMSAAAGAVIGIAVLLIAEKTIPHVHRWIRKKDIEQSKKKAALVAGAITIHNVPEGFAIASAFSGSPALGWLVTASMSLQDIPEGFIVSAPLSCYGMDAKKAVKFGVFSGIVEFAAAVAGFLFLSFVSSLNTVALAFSAGAMGYVVLVEIMPDALRSGNEHIAAIAFIIGAGVSFAIASLLGI